MKECVRTADSCSTKSTAVLLTSCSMLMSPRIIAAQAARCVSYAAMRTASISLLPARYPAKARSVIGGPVLASRNGPVPIVGWPGNEKFIVDRSESRNPSGRLVRMTTALVPSGVMDSIDVLTTLCGLLTRALVRISAARVLVRLVPSWNFRPGLSFRRRARFPSSHSHESIARPTGFPSQPKPMGASRTSESTTEFTPVVASPAWGNDVPMVTTVSCAVDVSALRQACIATAKSSTSAHARQSGARSDETSRRARRFMAKCLL